VVAEQPKGGSADASEQPTVCTTPLTQPTDEPAPEIPETIGRYRILREIDRGGMGVVLSGYDPDLERSVAIKVVKVRGVRNATEHQARMLREARAIARVRHPNVVHVYEVGEYDGGLFIAMEFIDGENLRQWRRADRPLGEILDVYRQAGLGLAAAHEAGLVHRDFKPANALLGPDGRVCVLDFGLAREGADRRVSTASDGPHQPVDTTSQVTAFGMIVGTPAYMSPEQLKGDPLDARSDQFSFCVALWEAVATRRPFSAETSQELRQMIAKGHPTDPDDKLPTWLREVLTRGLAFDREERFEHLGTLLAAISAARPQGKRYGPLAASTLAVIGAAAWFTQGPGEDPCIDGAQRAAEVWTQARRTEVTEALSQYDSPRARESIPLVVAHFDQYAERWRAAYVGACTSGQTRDPAATATFDEVAVCLGQRIAQFELRLELLDDAEAGQADRAIDIARSLPSIDECTEPSEIQRRRKLAPPPQDQEAVDALRAERDRLELRFRSGERTTVFEEIEQLVPRAEAIGNRALLSEILGFRGNARRSSTEPERSDADIRLAIAHAVAVGDDRHAASLSAALAYGFEHRGNSGEGLYWVGLAESFAEHGELMGGQRAVIARSRGELTIQAGQVAEGIGVLEDLVERLTVEPLDDGALQLARSELALGRGRNIHGDGEAAIELFRRARGRLAAQLGLHHPLVIQAQYYEGNALAGLGRSTEALEALTQYRQRAIDSGTWSSFEEVDWRLNAGSAHLTAKDYAAAAVELQRGLEQIEDGAKPHPTVHVQLLRMNAQANTGLGNLDAARDMLKAGQTLAKDTLPPASPEHMALATLSAKVMMQRGDFEAAIEGLEGVLRRAQERDSTRPAWPTALLAEALWRAELDDPRAEQLARDAISTPLRRTQVGDLAAQIDTWLREPPRGVPLAHFRE